MELFHITTAPAWAAAQRAGEYRAPSLAADGFIHLSSAAQWLATANRFYRGQPELILLVIDGDRLSAPVRWEDGAPPTADGAQFPHLYGPLNLDAVIDARPLPVTADGTIGAPRGTAP
ncbi:MAG: DUF952 domain-containing protein [Myxococcales bacterium]|nr:DUF952 domain-containing protein [Myxococcales bacterium]